MNWSNGQLARQSRRRYNTDATKQKQCLAQAKRQKATESQNQRYNGANFVPSYLKDVPENLDRTPRDGTRHREPRRRIVTLQDVPDTAQDALKSSEYESRPSKIKRPNGTLEVNGANIDAKRRKLLEQSDWSGVELQKPVVIEYPETTGLAGRFHRIVPDQSMSPIVKASKNHISANTVIKIANQKYRWSPGNDSIRTYHSTRRSALPETPLSTEKQVYNTSSSASKSLSSFVQESPCAGRALQVGRGRVNETQLQSVSHTSPSVYNEPLVKAGAEVQYFHPQPIRHMPQSVYTRLVNSAHNDDIEFRLGRLSPLFPQSKRPNHLPATENQSGESMALEQVDRAISNKISSCSRELNQVVISNRRPRFQTDPSTPTTRQPSPPSIDPVPDSELSKFRESLLSSIKTPVIHSLAEAYHPGKRLSALPYKCAQPATEQSRDSENIMWKRFILSPGHLGAVDSAASGSADTLDGNKTDYRSKLGVKTSAIEAPTRIASRLENTSPVPGTRRRQHPTTAPTGATLPPTISADTTDASLSNQPQATNNDETPVYSREERNSGEVMTAFPAEAKIESHFVLSEMQHMTTKAESTFHPPSLFVGRLAASVASVPVAVPSASEPPQDIPVPNPPSARVMSRWRRNKRREAGRPDIRALPNIRGDPIEFTP